MLILSNKGIKLIILLVKANFPSSKLFNLSADLSFSREGSSYYIILFSVLI